MKIIRSKDLKDRLMLLFADNHSTPTGGLTVSWRSGAHVWGMVESFSGADGYSPHVPGGGMSSGQGSVRNIPAARYRIVIHFVKGENQPKRFLWYTPTGQHLLEATRQPVLIQRQQFQQIITVETYDDRE